jgi:hypothetical protein
MLTDRQVLPPSLCGHKATQFLLPQFILCVTTPSLLPTLRNINHQQTCCVQLGEVVDLFSEALRHEDVTGSGDVAPHILNLCTGEVSC